MNPGFCTGISRSTGGWHSGRYRRNGALGQFGGISYRSHLPRVREYFGGDLYQMVQVRVNGQEIEIRHRKAYIRMNNQPISLDDFLVDGADLQLRSRQGLF